MILASIHIVSAPDVNHIWLKSTTAVKMASYHAQFIQFENWTPREVANWLQGLDESVAQYDSLFEASLVDGRKLLMLNNSDLEKMEITKLGHQELILEAVDLLRSLRYTLDTENLQSMALQLGCKARNVVTEIQIRQRETSQPSHARRELHRKHLSITVLSYLADMLATLKNLVSWLDRAPFEGIYDICRLRNSVVKLGLELVTVTQRESSYVDPEEAIIKSCRTLMECCDGLVRNTKDPLVIQPAALEQATIRKKQGEELGMNIQSAYNGIHGISSIKELSPADMSSKIEKGDEVLQVNGQTVLGWQLKELVKILKDKPKEVTLLLKKRPRHFNPLGAMQNHKRLAAKHAQQAATLPKSLKKRRSREGDPVKQTRPSLQEFVSAAGAAGDDSYISKDTPDRNEGDGNDTDNDVFRSGSESPQYTLPVMPDPKQRRATVSGGSPTFEHNSLMVEDPVGRPKSQAINKAERDAALAILAASENSLMTRSAEGTGLEQQAGKAEGAVTQTSSESSSGQKGQSESEMEDSVFSSDKEEKDHQTTKQTADVKRQEFRATKPTPVIVEPVGSASAQSKPPVRKTSSSSSVSSTTSASTVISSPNPAAKASAGDDSTQDPFDKPVYIKHPPKSPSGKWRPPSPVSAPPKRNKSLSSPVSNEGSQSAEPKQTTSAQMDKSGSASEPTVVGKTQTLSDAAEIEKVDVTVSLASDAAGASKPPCGAATLLDSASSDVSKTGTQHGVKAGSSAKMSFTSSGSVSVAQSSGAGVNNFGRESVNSTSSVRQSTSSTNSTVSTGRVEKPPILVLESPGTPQDHRPQSVQDAIQTEVALDQQQKDGPKLMKIKKLESPKATDVSAPNPLSEECAAKQKKRVEFSPDAKESSPPRDVSYTHIVVGGVVQKIPVDQAPTTGTDSPPVKMRQKSGNRRLDRRVSCKDLGKGDCEGWLYKRKEKDRKLAKHWSKRWCVLKNYNLYYYKHKEDLKAEGVIYMPAFQVSPAPDLKTKKFPFKVHNPGTTFYFASERQDDMSKWMNKMGLAAISFDSSQMVTTGGFIKPEPRSNHLGMANAYYSESEEEVDEMSQFGSALSLNSLSSLGSVATPQPSPPVYKRAVGPINSDPGMQTHQSAQPQSPRLPVTGPAGAASLKGERTGGSRY